MYLCAKHVYHYLVAVNATRYFLRKLRSQKRSLRKNLRRQPQSLTLRTKYRDCVNDWRQSLHNHKLAQERHIIESKNLGAF